MSIFNKDEFMRYLGVPKYFKGTQLEREQND